MIFEIALQRFRYFRIHPRHQSGTLIDESDMNAKARKNAGIFGPDDSRANYSKGLRLGSQFQNSIAIENRSLVERNAGGAIRACARGNDDETGFYAGGSRRGNDFHFLWSNKVRAAGKKVHGISFELLRDDLGFLLNDFPRAVHRKLKRIGSVLVAGQGGFPQSFRRYRSGMKTGAADFLFLDDSNALAQFCGLDGGTLPAGSRPNHYHVE